MLTRNRITHYRPEETVRLNAGGFGREGRSDHAVCFLRGIRKAGHAAGESAEAVRSIRSQCRLPADWPDRGQGFAASVGKTVHTES